MTSNLPGIPLTPPIPILRVSLLIAVRFLVALALSLWIGGMAFFGIMAAPVLFHPEKSGIPRDANTATIAPQMVSAMLTRFGTLTNICIVVLLIGWMLDGFLSRTVKTKSWTVQGGLTVICLALSQYLNVSLLPQTKAQQSEILPLIARAEEGGKLTNAEQTRRAAFDTGHESYKKLASLNLYLLMAVMVVLLIRSRQVGLGSLETGKLGKE